MGKDSKKEKRLKQAKKQVEKAVQKEEGLTEFNFKDKRSWQSALNKAPNSKLLKTRRLGGNKTHTYLPIEFQQALQDVFFDEFDVIDERYFVIENELVCTLKCKGLPSYPFADYRIFTGSAACPIQTKSGSDVAKFPKGKITNALEYNLPKARTASISKTLETIGNIFGRNLGRAVESNYNMTERIKKKKNAKSKGK